MTSTGTLTAYVGGKMRKTHLNPRIRAEFDKAIQRYRTGDEKAYLELMKKYNLTVIDLLRLL